MRILHSILKDAGESDTRIPLLWQCFRLLLSGKEDPLLEEMSESLRLNGPIYRSGELLLPVTQDLLLSRSRQVPPTEEE